MHHSVGIGSMAPYVLAFWWVGESSAYCVSVRLMRFRTTGTIGRDGGCACDASFSLQSRMIVISWGSIVDVARAE